MSYNSPRSVCMGFNHDTGATAIFILTDEGIKSWEIPPSDGFINKIKRFFKIRSIIHYIKKYYPHYAKQLTDGSQCCA